MPTKKIPFVDLQAQYRSIKLEIDQALASILEDASFIKGKPVAQFESSFADYCESKACVGVGNGTDALTLTLRALGISHGDEVITVSHTFIATAEAITNVGAKPVFVDIRDDTMLMNPELIEDAITPQTKAIIPVHLYGNPCDMDAISDIAQSHDLLVIEDAAQAHGARWKGRRVGSFGSAACFSFYPGKNLGAYGDGGAVVSNDTDLIDKIRMIADHGRKEKYLHEIPGVNSRLDAIQAAVLSVKLKHLDEWNQRRRDHANTYLKGLSSLPLETLRIEKDAEPVWHIFPIRTEKGEEIREMLNKNLIETGVHYPVPVHKQPAYCQYNHQSLSVTEKVAEHIISLPMYPEIEGEEIKMICDIIAEEISKL
jgi:dTDP-4-amino-4,6-dideoxygalactose transaminase